MNSGTRNIWGGKQQGCEVTSKHSEIPFFEQLEPRLLLSADISGLQLTVPTVSTSCEQAIEIDLDFQQKETVYNEFASIMTLDAPSSEDSQEMLPSVVEEQNDQDNNDVSDDNVSLTVQSQLIIDHTCTDLTQIPLSAIEHAKATLHIAYGYTSHGSQITTGMNDLVEFINNGGLGLSYPEDTFAFNDGGTDGALDLSYRPVFWDYGAYDLGNPDRTAWEAVTREHLNTHPEVNVIMWAWCGQHNTTIENIDIYLNLMEGLIADYPNVQFVFMTGHLAGQGLDGPVNLANEHIREHCLQYNRILYDYADIDSYDPDGQVNYMPLLANDNCDYDSDGDGTLDSNWAIDWQNSHTEGEDWYESPFIPTGIPTHTQSLNVNLKAYAAWWLWTTLAGWNQETNTVPVRDAEFYLDDRGKAQYTDANGDLVTVTLTGDGTGTLYFPHDGPSDIEYIELTGTTEKSSLTINTKGSTTINDIIVHGPLKSISAKTTDLLGDITVDGWLGKIIMNDVADDNFIFIGVSGQSKPITLKFDEVADLTIESDTPIKSITATEWIGGSITAPWISSLSIKGGDFSADLILDDYNNRGIALNKLSIAGTITESDIVAQGAIGSIEVGAMWNSSCFVVTGITLDTNLDGVPDLPNPAIDISLDSLYTIKKLTIKGIKGYSGDCFVNSNIVAANIGKISLICPQYDNTGVPFGLAADFIKKVTITDNNGKKSFKNLSMPGDSIQDQDFDIRLV